MFSEFEIVKPRRNFSQLHLEFNEVVFHSIRAKMLLGIDGIKGVLHLNSRSILFEPADIEFPIVRFKFCDSMKMSVGQDMTQKQIITRMMNITKEGAVCESIKNMFLRDELSSKIEKINKPGKAVTGVFDLIQIQIKKIVKIDRNPPSPYSIERFYKSVHFEIHEQADLKIFLKKFNYIMSSEDEEELLSSYVKNLVQNALKQYMEASKEKIIYFTHCKLVQLFESFYGFLVVKASKILEFIPVVNKTKELNIQIQMSEVKYVNNHRYMFKPIGLEVFVHTSNESFLFVFDDKATKETVREIITCNSPKILDIHLDVIIKMWMNGLISNYDYLICLNRFSSRSFNDISQYPIFPWIVSEFHDDEFKINSKSYYRNLAKPIGSLNKNRFQRVMENYEKMKTDKCKPHPPHYYNSFYSTPGYVIFFYMRSIPELILKLQNGPFGPTERIFKSLESLWNTMHSTGCNLTELIPEFFSPNKPDFLLNTHRLDLGYTPDGDEIDDVSLPRWAEDIPDFMYIMRAALESEYASLCLNQWIDLIWGFQQRGKEAEAANNVYYHLCYEENVHWEEYKNPYHRKSIEIQLAEYGQVPIQLFQTAHPKKKIKIPLSLANNHSQKKGDEEVKCLKNKLQESQDEVARLKSKLNNAYKSRSPKQEDELGLNFPSSSEQDLHDISSLKKSDIDFDPDVARDQWTSE